MNLVEDYRYILDALPYCEPFLFVDSIDLATPEHITGRYTIRQDEYFLQGHFPDHPVVPGAIIMEIMGQIGLVCMGIEILRDTDHLLPIFSSSYVDYFKKVSPGDQLIVESEKKYFRLNKLKCMIKCKTLDGELVAKGEFSGIIVNKKDLE